MSNHHRSTGLMARLFRAGGNLIALSERGKGRLCILTYHRILESKDPLLAWEIDAPDFRWQMQLLADCFNVLPLHEAIQALQEKRLPPRAICITFDDGYRSIHDLALPILQEFGLPATVFTTTAYMDGGNMWNDRIIEAVRRLPNGPLDLRALGLGLHTLKDLHHREDILGKLNEGVKYLRPQARLEVIDALEQLARVSDGAAAAAVADLMLNREMIASLSRSGIEIGGHTVTHPILNKLDDDLARREIVDNKHALEAIVGKPLRFFAYPNGKAGVDFAPRHVRMVQEAGYSAAFTTAIGSASRFSNAYQIPRSRPWDATPFLFGLRLLRWLAYKVV
jgi:peptidoglycan/xylan/chitin deacetylase (PgdA/CDA1 family)